jgi:ubiquinone biosynthesis protein UbiJ
MNALVGLINRACRELLEVDPDGRQKLTALEGKVLCIEITVPQMKLYLKPSSEGFEISENSEAEPDVTLSGSVMAFARLGTSGVGSRVLSEGQVTMQGDAETDISEDSGATGYRLGGVAIPVYRRYARKKSGQCVA